jgi:hypothetical protein
MGEGFSVTADTDEELANSANRGLQGQGALVEAMLCLRRSIERYSRALVFLTVVLLVVTLLAAAPDLRKVADKGAALAFCRLEYSDATKQTVFPEAYTKVRLCMRGQGFEFEDAPEEGNKSSQTTDLCWRDADAPGNTDLQGNVAAGVKVPYYNPRCYHRVYRWNQNYTY